MPAHHGTGHRQGLEVTREGLRTELSALSGATGVPPRPPSTWSAFSRGAGWDLISTRLGQNSSSLGDGARTHLLFVSNLRPSGFNPAHHRPTQLPAPIRAQSYEFATERQVGQGRGSAMNRSARPSHPPVDSGLHWTPWGSSLGPPPPRPTPAPGSAKPPFSHSWGISLHYQESS